MSFCKSCGTGFGEETAFCTSCGKSSQPEVAPAVGVAENSGASVSATAAQPMATNVAGALTYLVGAITGIIFLVIDPYKSNSFVRFHAFQSIFFTVAWFAFWIVWMVVSGICSYLTSGLSAFLSLPLSLLVGLGGFAFWLFLMYQAYQQKLYRIPFLGKFAAQQAGVKP